MKRIHEKYIAKWLKKSNCKPLVIRGARQVGKSTLVRNIAKSNNLNIFEINLERHLKLAPLFATFSIKDLLNEIELICGKHGITNQDSILFLDEIQAIPEAIPALRYIKEDYPTLKIIAAGSLLEFVLSEHSFSMPVGRIEYLFMGPMSFYEFLEAKNEHFLLNYIEKHSLNNKFSETIHKKMIILLKDYFLVGGMPEAVKTYVNGSSFEEISSIHTSIIETYLDDFAKYAKGQTLQTLQKVFNYTGTTPGQKIKYSNIDSDIQARELKLAIKLLEKAKIIFPVYHSAASSIPLSVSKKSKIYKLFFLDIGLVNNISGINGISIDEIKKNNFINKGVIAEQFIAQHLLSICPLNKTPELYYWLRENKSNNAELDFVIQLNNLILPIEVKAGAKGSLKSMQRFVFEKNINLAVRFDLNEPSIQKIEAKIKNSVENAEIKFKLISLPIYMVGQMNRLLNQCKK